MANWRAGGKEGLRLSISRRCVVNGENLKGKNYAVAPLRLTGLQAAQAGDSIRRRENATVLLGVFSSHVWPNGIHNQKVSDRIPLPVDFHQLIAVPRRKLLQ